MTSESTRDGLAGALRKWRTRRRVSQLELALRAGTTQRHLSFIESGRSAPGRSMIIRLGEALDVPIRERNELLLAAGFAPAYPETRLDGPQLAPIRAALERILHGHLPYPAVVVDRHGDLVSANTAFHVLTTGVAPHLLEAPVSVPRVLLHPQGLASRIINLDEWAWHIIDSVQAENLRNPDDRLGRLARDLTHLAPPRPSASSHHLGFAVPLRLRAPDPADGRELTLITTLTHFGTATDVTIAELRLEAFLPADRSTSAQLAELLSLASSGSQT
ncbi:helix-turn-helix transcriptional regulator [Streptomyces sp. NPDC046716]|uniref:helix-turn-helix domain-containing protein n=1 Tax=Streptomyces sp. NPDC046716 TaxID=3157093 RepID=UPI0033FF2EDD